MLRAYRRTRQILRDLRLTNDSYAMIAKRHKVTRQWVHQIKTRAERQGIQMPSRPRGRPKKPE